MLFIKLKIKKQLKKHIQRELLPKIIHCYLANKQSASASEVMIGALKDEYGAKVVGEATFGKGTVQELQTISSGDQYKITTKKWLTPSGYWVNEKGIIPDIEISLNENYYLNPTEENDNQLQKALELLRNNVVLNLRFFFSFFKKSL